MLDTVGWVTWTARLTRQRARRSSRLPAPFPTGPRSRPVPRSRAGSPTSSSKPSVQVATPETDAEWADAAPGWTATVAARLRPATGRPLTRDEAVETRPPAPRLTYRWDSKRGELRLRGRIPDADGALVAAALDAAADRYGPVEGGAWDPYPRAVRGRRCVERAEPGPRRRVRGVPRHDRRARAPRPRPRRLDRARRAPRCRRRRGRRSPTRRPGSSSCDSKVQSARRGRQVPADQLRSPDPDRPGPHCSGCSRSATCTAGRPAAPAPVACTPTTSCTGSTAAPTDLDNLVLLCSRHHTMLHEYGWTIRGKPERRLELEFHDRHGSPRRPLARTTPTRHRRSRVGLLVSTT